jgi:hypothetical protein
VNFQVTVLKVLVSYPDGFANLADLKRDMAIPITSGREWSERTKKLAARVPGLEIFAQGLIERRDGGWLITAAGRSVLAFMETGPEIIEQRPGEIVVTDAPAEIVRPGLPVVSGTERRRPKRRRRASNEARQSSKAS